MRSRVCRRLALPVVLSALVVAAFAQPAAAAVEPYGANDAGGFRNVLPPGYNGLDNIAQISRSVGSGRCRRTTPISSRSTKTSATARRG